MEDKYSYLLNALEDVRKYMKDNQITRGIRRSFCQLEYYLNHEEEFTEEQRGVINKGLERITFQKMIKEEIKKLDN